MRNEEKYIGPCLAALCAQDYPSHLLEILVVDGLSEDRSPEIVREWQARHPHIRLLDNERKTTPAGFNVGIRAAGGDLIALVSAHCEVAPDYISQCVHYLDKTGADNVGGLMRPVSDTYWGQAIALSMGSPFGVGDSRFHFSAQEQFVDTVYMGTYRREVFDRIGLFDESLVRNQDYELNYRLRRAGGRIFCTPAIRSRYYARSTPGALWRQYCQYGFWKARVVRLHPRSVRWRQLVAPAFVAAVCGSAVLAWFLRPFKLLLAMVLTAYAVMSLTFSFFIALREGWRYFWGLPVTFGIMHVGWGLGFWWGMIRFALRGFRED